MISIAMTIGYSYKETTREVRTDDKGRVVSGIRTSLSLPTR